MRWVFFAMTPCYAICTKNTVVVCLPFAHLILITDLIIRTYDLQLIKSYVINSALSYDSLVPGADL